MLSVQVGRLPGQAGRLQSTTYRGFTRAPEAASEHPPRGIRIEKLLVSNRGEIACRVIRTARRMGLRTVAVYSDADRDALHVLQADEAVRLGPALAANSYLKQSSILEAAARTGSQAVHPGYGFLSENAEFAELCRRHGVEFVGPPAAAIRAMGDKSAAKELMTSAGVPVVPGYHGEDQSEERLRHEAAGVGYPLLIKATQGGGGKGMRVVWSEKEFKEGLEGAVREALASFGNGRVLLERYVQRPRHVEVQIFGDKWGNVVHLFERDCSVQRRHQKILEEAPAPRLAPGVRERLGHAAVEAGRAVGYESAGTVEFIFDCDTDEFFFMEMNTRLQVEHPVTEMVVNEDLVEWQIRVARGEALPLSQPQISCTGHAFEARVYAENVPRGFLPSSGPLLHYQPPLEVPGAVRVESGVMQGDAITTFYDPLIAKLVVWGPDRGAALRRLQQSLAEYRIAGLPTNLPLLSAIASHPGFQAADLDTHFIARHRSHLLPQDAETASSGELLQAGESPGSHSPPLADGQRRETAAVAAAVSKCLVDRALQQGVAGSGSSGSGRPQALHVQQWVPRGSEPDWGSGRQRGGGRMEVDPWLDGCGFRVNHTYKQPFTLSHSPEEGGPPHDAAPVSVLVEYHQDASFTARVGATALPVAGDVLCVSEVQAQDPSSTLPRHATHKATNAQLDLTLNGWRSPVAFCNYVRGGVGSIHVWLGVPDGPSHYRFTYPSPSFLPPDLDHPEYADAAAGVGPAALHGPGAVVAPMAGRVVRVCVEEGATVQRGEPTVILESMKMEHTVRAPRSGKVLQVVVRQSQQVVDGGLLAIVDPEEK